MKNNKAADNDKNDSGTVEICRKEDMGNPTKDIDKTFKTEMSTRCLQNPLYLNSKRRWTPYNTE